MSDFSPGSTRRGDIGLNMGPAQDAPRTMFHPLAVDMLAVAWGVAGCLFAVFYGASEWPALVGVMMVSQAFCGRLVWYRFRETQQAVLPDFLSLLLFSKLYTKTLTILAVLANENADSMGSVGAESSSLMMEISYVPMGYQFQAELVFLTATLIFTYLWLWLERGRLLAVWREPPTTAAWQFYAATILAYFGLGAFGTGFRELQGICQNCSLAAIAILLGGSSVYALGSRRSWLAVLALAPVTVQALRSGMKSQMALVLLPILLPIFRRRLTIPRLTAIAGVVVLILLFVIPFSNTWRERNWYRHESVDIAKVASQVSIQWEREGVLQTSINSTAQWLSRNSTSIMGGLVMEVAQRDGFLGPVLLRNLTVVFIPRFLWPEKPSYAPGAWFTWYLGYASSPETATSSTAIMLFTELYWMFGAAGMVACTILITFLLFYVYRHLFRKSGTGPAYLGGLYCMLMMTPMFEEESTIYVLSSPIILLVYVAILDRLQKVAFPSLSKNF